MNATNNWNLERNLSTTHPGAGAIEYQSLLQIVIEDLLGWDINKGKPNGKGVFGVLEAFGATTEEQQRNALHSHLLIWIKNFNKLREDLFSDVISTRTKAREDLKDYISKIMVAKYPDLEFDHYDKDGNSCKGELKSVSDQEIQNMRRKVCLRS